MKKIEPKDIDDDLFCYYDEIGELPTDWEQVTFFDEKRFDLGEIARMKMNFKLGIETKYDDENGKFLNINDLIVSLKYYLNLVY